jgi:hypothetical protein
MTGGNMTDLPMSRGPYDQLTGPDLQKVEQWAKDKEAQALFQTQLREFIETKPLYSNYKLTLPPGRTQFFLEVARLYCTNCKTLQPFRQPKISQWYNIHDKELRYSEKQILRSWDLLQNCIYPIELYCQECHKGFYDFFVLVQVKEGSVMKFGQVPMWTPFIENDLRKQLGPSAQFYYKALQNLNLSYGIGACAYFRRMIESYINPLLTLLHDYKKDKGAPDDELIEIQKVIKSHVFSAKTEYAAQICPDALIVGGMNPLKEIHELLSSNIHEGTDAEATDIALKLRGAIEFTVKALNRHYQEQKDFIESMKKNRSNPSE